MVMPVDTPRTKLIPNRVPQNFVMSFQTWRPVMTYTLSMIASMKARPSVSGMNRKWYMAVSANCHRDRSTTSISTIKRLHPAATSRAFKPAASGEI